MPDPFTTEIITTRRDVTAPVRLYGPEDGPAVLALHGAGGWMPSEPVLEGLAEEGFRVAAPVWPAFSEHDDEDKLEDMLDFALHGWDVVTELGLDRPHLMGHSMGGMIAAEMAAIAPQSADRIALLCPAGMWIDSAPIPDIFAMLPFELAEVLFADPEVGQAVLTGGVDFSDDAALAAFMVARARQQGMAGKILFPIPNRRLSKRAYRITNPVHLVWGKQDKLIAPLYADVWGQSIENCSTTFVDDAGHMLPHEQPGATLSAILGHLQR